jgi:hypothetical protein
MKVFMKINMDATGGNFQKENHLGIFNEWMRSVAQSGLSELKVVQFFKS